MYVLCTGWYVRVCMCPTFKVVCNMCMCILHGGCVCVCTHIRESVDSLRRDGPDAQYMQYLSKSRITSTQIC